MATHDATSRAGLLRDAADFIEQHPEIGFYLTLNAAGVTLADYSPNSREDLAERTRQLGGFWEKIESDTFFTLRQKRGALTIELTAWRKDVCERVQVDERTVTEPDPDRIAALVAAGEVATVTRSEPIYEWRCPPTILAAVGSETAA